MYGVSGSRWLLVTVTLLALKPLFAVRALRAAAFEVRDALARGDLAAARVGLGSLCSRKADQLDEQELVGATIESIAENASDSFVAPVFFFVLFGLPGAAWYRAVNTLDAMIGYHGRFEWVGKTAARMDDVLNWLPARFTAACLLCAAVLLRADARRAWRVLLRDRGLTESPNAGQPMAAMAGLLGVRLEKAGHYALGDATRPLQARQITEAWRLVAFALGLWLAVSTAALLCLAQFAALPWATPWAAPGGPFG
jgi:adenosylcobinamide-phosphate synthase